MTDALLTTVRNAARLLKAFRTREESLGVSELARRLGLGKSVVHRLLVTLAAEGLVEQDGRGYRLGIVMYELGEAVRVHLDLHGAAAPVLVHVREQTGESVQIGVLDGIEVVYVDRLESAHSLRLLTETGRRVPAHCTSSGKVLLAHLDPVVLDGHLARPLVRLTPHTIVDPDMLRAELRRVRSRGWASAVDEREVGVASLAAPICDASGAVVAALSVAAPVARVGARQRRRIAADVVEGAEAVSRRLGHAPERSERGTSVGTERSERGTSMGAERSERGTSAGTGRAVPHTGTADVTRAGTPTRLGAVPIAVTSQHRQE